MAITRKQPERFVANRNKSPFNNNLQFGIDARACGFQVGDLGPVTKLESGGYRWETPHGALVEEYGRIRLEAKEG